MTDTTTREVGALNVEGYGPMNAEMARETIATVERLNTEARDLTRERDALAERASYLTSERDTLAVRIEHLENERDSLARERDQYRYNQVGADDPRLGDLWETAYRYAANAGFCSEFERIADALGVPPQSLDWTGTAWVDVTVRVAVPAHGNAPRHDVTSGDVDYEPDTYDVADHLNELTITHHEIQEWDVVEVIDVYAQDL